LQKEPDNKKSKLLRAQLDLIQGNTKQSIDELKKMQENDPENQNLLIGTVEMLRQEKKFDEIIELLKNKKGLNQPLQLYLGEAYYFKSDWTNLRETYANIPLQNFNIYFEIIIAEAELRSRNFETAIAYYHNILKRDSSESFAYYGMGFSLIQQKRFEEAEKVLQKGLVKAKDKSTLYNLLSDALIELNKTERAITMLLELEKERPEDWQIKASLANAYQKTGKIKESDSYFESAIKISNNVTLMNNYAYNLSKRENNLERAEELMKKALSEEPNNSYFLDTMGWIYYKLKKYKLAQSYISRAIERRDQGDESFELFDHLGDVYQALGEIDKAIINWKKALEIDAKQKNIREKLEKYEKKK
jgi:tetratricopeptide (TPR) repeat protein